MQTGERWGEGSVKPTGCKFPFPTLTVAACKTGREQFWIGKSVGSSNDELKCSSN